MTNPEAIAMFESIHDEGIRFLEQVYAKNTQFVSPELLQCIGSEEEFEKIGFSIGFYQEDGVWNLRLKFSFKNPGENAGSLETLEHSICRVDQEIPHIPDQTRIRNLVKNTFGI